MCCGGWSQEAVHGLQHGGRRDAAHQITADVSWVVYLTNTETYGTRITLSRNIHDLLWPSARLEFSLDRRTGSHAGLIEIPGVWGSPHQLMLLSKV